MIDLTHVETLLGNIQGFVGEKTLNIAARVAREEILRKTASGVDYTGTPFLPYTSLYSKRRQRQGFRTDVVDLRVTGDMLDSIHLEGDTLTLDESQIPKAQGNEERWGREFMNIDDSTLELIEREILMEFEEEAKGWISNQ